MLLGKILIGFLIYLLIGEVLVWTSAIVIFALLTKQYGLDRAYEVVTRVYEGPTMNANRKFKGQFTTSLIIGTIAWPARFSNIPSAMIELVESIEKVDVKETEETIEKTES